MVRSASAQQFTANEEQQRARAVPVTTERRPLHGPTTVLVALPRPRHAASAVADVAASHGALNGPVLLIEGVRTHVSAISTGALAVFRASSTPNPGAALGKALSSQFAALFARVCDEHWKSYIQVFGARGWLPAGAWLNGLTRFYEIARLQVRDSDFRPRGTRIHF